MRSPVLLAASLLLTTLSGAVALPAPPGPPPADAAAPPDVARPESPPEDPPPSEPPVHAVQHPVSKDTVYRPPYWTHTQDPVVSTYRHMDGLLAYEGAWVSTPRWRVARAGAVPGPNGPGNAAAVRFGFEFVGSEFVLLGHVPPSSGGGEPDTAIVHVEVDGRSERVELISSSRGWDRGGNGTLEGKLTAENGGRVGAGGKSPRVDERYLLSVDDYTMRDGEGMAFGPHTVVITLERGALAVFGVVVLGGTKVPSHPKYIPSVAFAREQVMELGTDDAAAWKNTSVVYDSGDMWYSAIMRPLLDYLRLNGSMRTSPKARERVMSVFKYTPTKPMSGIIATRDTTLTLRPPLGTTRILLIGAPKPSSGYLLANGTPMAKEVGYSVTVTPEQPSYERTPEYTLSTETHVRLTLFSWPLDPMVEQLMTLHAPEGMVVLGVEFSIPDKPVPFEGSSRPAQVRPQAQPMVDRGNAWLYKGPLAVLFLTVVGFSTMFVRRLNRALAPPGPRARRRSGRITPPTGGSRSAVTEVELADVEARLLEKSGGSSQGSSTSTSPVR